MRGFANTRGAHRREAARPENRTGDEEMNDMTGLRHQSDAGGGFSRPASLAPLKNVAAMRGLAERLLDRGAHMPGLGVVHGYSGYGKTYAAIYVQNRIGGPRVEIGDSWNRKTFVRAILRELGLRDPRGTVAEMVEQIIERMAAPGHPPLFIDEADRLVDKKMIELVREIHEGAQVPVILIGEEDLPKKLMATERVHNRVLDWVTAQPCDGEDTRKLVELFVPQLRLSDGLVEAIRRASEGRARRIVTNLNRIGEFAAVRGLSELDETAYSAGFFTGQPPLRGRAA